MQKRSMFLLSLTTVSFLFGASLAQAGVVVDKNARGGTGESFVCQSCNRPVKEGEKVIVSDTAEKKAAAGVQTEQSKAPDVVQELGPESQMSVPADVQ